MLDTLLTGATLASAETGEVRGDLGIKDGRIAALLEPSSTAEARQRLDVSGCYILPGVIDPHVHIGHGQPHAEDFFTESRSAAVGGVTTILSYFRKEPYDYRRLVPELIEQGEQNSVADFGIHLVIGTEQHLAELSAYVEMGITSFKFFLGHQDRGILEVTSLPHTGAHIPIDDDFILRGFEELSKYPGTLAVAHCENSEINAGALRIAKSQGISGLAGWSRSRPDYSETEGVRRAAYWAELSDIPLYLVHLGSPRSVREAARQRAGRAQPIYVESLIQYQYLTYDCELGPLVKMNPPLRGSNERAELRALLAEGFLDVLASDHGSFAAKDKADAYTGRSGTPSAGLILPGLLNDGYRAGTLSLTDVARLTSTNAARIFGIYPRKGALRIGSDADLAVVDVDRKQTVTPQLMQSSADYSAFQGLELTGWPVLTIRRGEVVMADGELRAPRGSGRYLRREPVVDRRVATA